MHIGILSILALLMLSSAEAQLIDRAFFRQPHSASAAERTHHIFVCELTATPNKVVWLRQTLLMDGYEILTTDHAVRNDYAEKIFFVSEENLMNYSIVIQDLMVTDEGSYMCVADFKEGQFRSAPAHLVVLVPPRKLSVVTGAETNCTAGLTCGITCEAKCTRPAVKLHWLLHAVIEESSSCQHEACECANEYPSCDGSFCTNCTTVTCSLFFTANHSDHQAPVTCVASGLAVTQDMITETRLNVQFVPEVDMYVIPNDVPLQEGMRVQFFCHIESRPPYDFIEWTLEDTRLPCDNASCIVHPLRREHNGQVIQCEVGNAAGHTIASHTLEVLYAPRFAQLDAAYIADLGDSVTLHCEVDANPAASITWFRPWDLHTPISDMDTLQIDSLTAEAFGEYVCIARSPSLFYQHDHVTSVHVLEKHAPRVLGLQQIYVTVDQTAKIPCTIDAVPPASSFLWSRNGFALPGNNSRYSLRLERFLKGSTSVLIVESFTSDDLGDYNCTAVNELGAVQSVIRVSQHRPDLKFVAAYSAAAAFASLLVSLAALLAYYAARTRRLLRISVRYQPQADYRHGRASRSQSERNANLESLISAAPLDFTAETCSEQISDSVISCESTSTQQLQITNERLY